jgi:hypothetical protein
MHEMRHTGHADGHAGSWGLSSHHFKAFTPPYPHIDIEYHHLGASTGRVPFQRVTACRAPVQRGRPIADQISATNLNIPSSFGAIGCVSVLFGIVLFLSQTYLARCGFFDCRLALGVGTGTSAELAQGAVPTRTIPIPCVPCINCEGDLITALRRGWPCDVDTNDSARTSIRLQHHHREPICRYLHDSENLVSVCR